MIKLKNFFLPRSKKDVSLKEKLTLIGEEISALDSFMGDDEDDYEAQQIRRKYELLVEEAKKSLVEKKARGISRRFSRDDTYFRERRALGTELDRTRAVISKTSHVRQSSELAPTIFKKRPVRSPTRFWTLNFHTFVIPGYPDPWKLLSYSHEEFMKWWIKARQDTNAERTDGWVDIRLFVRKVFHLVMYPRTEAMQRSIFLKRVENLAEKAKQIARVVALLYGVSDSYDSPIQAIFECCPPVIYLLKKAFEGCINTVESPDENEEVANGLSDLDLMSIEPLLTDIANRLFILQEHTPLTRGRDIIKLNLLENIHGPSGSAVLTSSDDTPHTYLHSQRAEDIMVGEGLADKKNMEELRTVARGLQMAESTLRMLPLPSARCLSDTDNIGGDALDIIYLKNMSIKKMSLQFEGDTYWGEGSFSQVLRARSKDDGKEYAVKILKQGNGIKKRFIEEVKVWAQLNDDFILRLEGFCVLEFSPLPGLVTELCQGSLKDLIVNSSGHITGEDSLSLVQRLEFLRDVNYGLRYLHSKSIAHGDLRAVNILITYPTRDGDRRPRAILCDFGISKSEIQVVEDIAAHVIAGKRLSEAWRPPEIVTYYREKNQVCVSSEGDMYSYGCVFLEVVYDREPFKDVNSPGDELLKGGLPAEFGDLPGLKAAHRSFMEALWAFDPKKRPDANTVSVEINELIVSWNDSS
ncbi:hypothetical protein M0805_002648 [Coniferiporia weirii]|nr:hypothetical protein M0805_002648 [Coniferiporia weirii]